jgi:chromosome segregation ATPase
MSKSVESQSPSSKKADSRIEELQLRIAQLENELLLRDQASFERLDALAHSSEALQSNYQKAIQDRAELSTALERSQVQNRMLQHHLDLSEHQLSDLRLAHAELESQLGKLRDSWNDETNHKLQLASECRSLRQQVGELDQLRESHSLLLATIRDLDQMIDQAELRCLHKSSASGHSASQLQDLLAEAELRIAELSSSLESERAFYSSGQEQQQQQLEGLRLSLASAQQDYAALLERYEATDSQDQENRALIQSLSEANQLLHSELQTLEARLASLDQAHLAQKQELEASERTVADLTAIVESHQQLSLANQELTQAIQALSERERDLSAQLEHLRSDYAINQQVLDQQLQLAEAQRQDAERRIDQTSMELDQWRLRHQSALESMQCFQVDLKDQLCDLRAALAPHTESPANSAG